MPTDQIAALIRANAGTWLAILAEDPELLARRVRDDRWSPLEYSCHVRDVFHVMDERLNLMIRLDDPTSGEGEATAPPSQSRPSVSMRCTTSCIISKR
ncbi:MAG: hypothetical protein ABSA14_14335 [Acidimicrobiales bacterium]